MLSVKRVTLHGRVSASSARMAASISILLLVVSGSPPEISFSRAPARITAPQPPGPGLPLQAPSVKISTSLIGGEGSGGQLARKLEGHPLLDSVGGHFLDLVQRGEMVDHFAHQRLGRRRPG